jgi:hypothetical protein
MSLSRSPRVDTRISNQEQEFDNKYDSDEFEENENSVKTSSRISASSQTFTSLRPSSHKEPNGLSSNELKEKLIQIVKRKGIVDSLKVSEFLLIA